MFNNNNTVQDLKDFIKSLFEFSVWMQQYILLPVVPFITLLLFHVNAYGRSVLASFITITTETAAGLVGIL